MTTATDTASDESAALGAALLAADEVLPVYAALGLRPSDFAEPWHRALFSSMLQMQRAGDVIDVLTVQRNTGADMDVLNQMLDACPVSTQGPFYAEQVIEASRKRRLGDLALSIGEASKNGKASVDILGDIRATLDTFEPATGTLTTLDAASWALESLPEPVQVLVESIDMATKNVIVAPSKARKSFFLLQAAVALAAGLPSFLAWRIPAPRRCLFWNLEITPAHFHKRLIRMLQALELSPSDLDDRFMILNTRGIDVALSQLPELIKTNRVEVVFLDPIYKILSGNESDQDEVKCLLRELDRLCTKTGCAVVYSHHCGKGFSGDKQAIDRASGSGVLARDFDCQVSLVPHVEDGLFVVEQIARSYPPRDVFSISWDERGCFTMANNVAPVMQTSKNRSTSGRIGPALTDADALDCVSSHPLPSEVFRGELRRKGFTDHGAREVKARLIETGQLAVMKTRSFPHKVYIGLPEGIAAMQRMKSDE